MHFLTKQESCLVFLQPEQSPPAGHWKEYRHFQAGFIFLDVEVTHMFYKHMLQSDSADLCGDAGSCSMMVMKRGPSKQEVYPAVFLNRKS